MKTRQALIDELKTVLRAADTHPALRETFEGQIKAGTPQAPAGTLNEVWGDNLRSGGASLGFALMQARGVITGRRGALVYLCLSGEVRETGLPYGPGLSGFGIDPGLMVVGRIQKTGDLLWAIEEAAACRAVAAVIADIVRPHRELDFTVSRRLAMRAVASGAAIFMLRYGSDREASAAHLRWHVAPAPSAGLAFDAKAPGAARFAVRLEKGGRRFLGDGAADRWQVEWTHDGLAAQKDSAAGHRDEAALSGIVPAALGDRLSQTA